MPYITPDKRQDLEAITDALRDYLTVRPGDLNFVISTAVSEFLAEHGDPTYDVFNAAIGVLECAKLELYRRMVAPYEDKKKEANGDVYHPAC